MNHHTSQNLLWNKRQKLLPFLQKSLNCILGFILCHAAYVLSFTWSSISSTISRVVKRCNLTHFCVKNNIFSYKRFYLLKFYEWGKGEKREALDSLEKKVELRNSTFWNIWAKLGFWFLIWGTCQRWAISHLRLYISLYSQLS